MDAGGGLGRICYFGGEVDGDLWRRVDHDAAGAPGGHGFKGAGSGDIRFTTQGETLYGIALGWPVSAAFERVTVREVELVGPDLATGYLRGRVERITE